jgi:S-formylglutathione hydrolase FrmB
MRLAGKLMDHTGNHGMDRRMYSRALGHKRDVYVYLPPGYDPNQRYPVVFFLHGFAEDEKSFLRVVSWVDEAMDKGKLPAAIVVCPDGSVTGNLNPASPGSFFINSRLGDFEDYVLQDVWDLVCQNYSIRCEKEAHVLVGVSMGGFAAFNLGIRHRYAFGVVVGIFPPVNLRWMDDCGNYMANFNPYKWGWRTDLCKRTDIMGKVGLFTYRINKLVEPLFGCDDGAIYDVARENPIELIDRCKVRNGELEMYIAYAGRDEFNIDAQVESFLYLCKFRGIGVGVGYAPLGRHDGQTAYQLWPGIVEWLAPRLAPYSPATAQVYVERIEPTENKK